MNRLMFSKLVTGIGQADHLYITSEIKLDKPHNFEIMMDTGFSLGLAFPKRLIPTFKFTNGFLSTLMLADSSVVKGYTFLSTIVYADPVANTDIELGTSSIVFLDGVADPVAGIEFMKMMSPIYISWETEKVTWKDGRI